MLKPRIIPVLLLRGKGLVKGRRFKDHVYVGDPINAVQIYNQLEADEILFLDTLATKEGRTPDEKLIHQIADRCLLPFSIGGGIRSMKDAERVLRAGAEKICINTAGVVNPKLISEISSAFGSQSVIAVIDYKKNWLGKLSVYTNCGTQNTGKDVVETAVQLEQAGAGEIVVSAIDNEGEMVGYDLDTLRRVSSSVDVPVIASGGAGNATHFRQAIDAGASAAAAGSMFVFQGPRRGVLINYLSKEEKDAICR